MILREFFAKTLLLGSFLIFYSEKLNNKIFQTENVESGLNLTCFTKNNFDDDEKITIDKIANDKYSTIILNQIYFQDNSKSSKIDIKSNMDLEYIVNIADYANSKNLKVILKPLINNRSEESRTNIDPKNIDLWFEYYNKILKNLADLTNNSKIYAISIGCELEKILEKNHEKFNELANKLKKDNNYRLIYCLGISEENDIKKINLANKLNVDYIGLDFYVTMEKYNKEAFHEVVYYLREICKKAYHKPVQILLSEIDPRLRFRRNYHALRPYTPYFEEILMLEEA